MQGFLPILIFTIAVATVLNVVLRRFNIPTVIGYIFTGIAIGAVFGISLHDHERLEKVAEFGVAFLMFTIGLEFSTAHLNSMKREVFLFGGLQVLVSGGLFALLAMTVFGFGYQTALVAGAGLALSSTAIVLKILNENGRIKARYGRNSLGILIFQDIAVIPILLMITIFTNEGESLSDLLLTTLVNAVITLSILVVVGKYLFGHVLKVVSDTNSKEIYMGTILFMVVGSSYVAHKFGFSFSLGAFVAGMMIADTLYKYQVEADLIPFRDLLLGVFFVSVGLQINLSVAMLNIVPVIALTLAVMVIKALVMFSLLAFNGDRKNALKTAITLAQIGEFSLVVFSLLLAEKMLDSTLVQVVLLAIVTSMILTPFLINNVDRIVGLIFRGNAAEEALDQSSSIAGHVILAGYGLFGRVVSEQLETVGIDHVIITNNTDAFVKAREADKMVVFGDPWDRTLLENVRIHDAMGTIVALDDFDEIKKTGAAITLLDPDLKVIAKVPTETERHELRDFNFELILDGSTHAAGLLVDQINRSRLLAKETSRLQYLGDYSVEQPAEAIAKVEREQARLLDVISKTFDALRKGSDMLRVTAYSDSFKVLAGIIEDAIAAIMSQATLDAGGYERLNLLLGIQRQLCLINEVMQNLGTEIKHLEDDDKTRNLAHTTVEALDLVLLALKDIAEEYSDMDLKIFKKLTSRKGKGVSRIRESYLSRDKNLAPATKMCLVSATNHMERLKTLFGLVGDNYRRLAEVG